MAEGASKLETFKRLEENLQCSICMEQYNDPRVLECLHSFCFKCIKQHVGSSKIVKCPMCNQETGRPQGGITALKSNFFIKGLIDDVLRPSGKQEKELETRYCQSCDSHDMAIAHCEDCQFDICTQCLDDHKRLNVLKKHKVNEFTKGKKKSADAMEIQTLLNKIKQKLSNMKKPVESINKELGHTRAMIDEIERERDETLEAIKQRKDALMNYIEAFTNKMNEDVISNTRSRLGNAHSVLKAYSAKSQMYESACDQFSVLKEIDNENKLQTIKEFLEHLQDLNEKLKHHSMKVRPDLISKTEFVASENTEEYFQASCIFNIGFLKPIKRRNARKLICQSEHHTSDNMQRYVVECVQSAYDKYGHYPRNQRTFRNMSEHILGMFTRRYNRNGWGVVIYTHESAMGVLRYKNCFDIYIENLNIWLLEFE